jgi:hypothetical protein
MWLKLMTLTNGLILDLFSILALPIALTTLRGYLSIPATKHCNNSYLYFKLLTQN